MAIETFFICRRYIQCVTIDVTYESCAIIRDKKICEILFGFVSSLPVAAQVGCEKNVIVAKLKDKYYEYQNW